MTVQEQTEMFQQLRKDHPTWTHTFCSGYIHGYIREGERKQPEPGYHQSAIGGDEYAVGYLTGFAAARGVDAKIETWFAHARKS